MHIMHEKAEFKQDGIPNFMSKVSKESEWLAQIEQYLDLSQKIAFTVQTGRANCLVYCPRGNQSTPILCSLAQIFLDPYYRTFEGLKVLIHKEWNYFCHNFLGKN